MRKRFVAHCGLLQSLEELLIELQLSVVVQLFVLLEQGSLGLLLPSRFGGGDPLLQFCF